MVGMFWTKTLEAETVVIVDNRVDMGGLLLLSILLGKNISTISTHPT